MDSRLFVRWLPLFGFCAVIVYYFWFVYSHAINIPHWDDIYDFLKIVILTESADSAREAISELFRQYNDHRTSASRLLIYAIYLAEGELNFHTLTLLGNLALPLILLLFFVTVKDEKYRWVFMLVSALLLLNLRYFPLVLHAQATFAYFYVFFYAFGCLIALHRVTPPKFVLAVFLGTFASYTFAAGVVVWILGLVSLLHQHAVTRRVTYHYPALWLVVTVITLALWRTGFSDVSTDKVLTLLPDTLIEAPLYEQVLRYVSYFFVIMGSAFTDTSTVVAGVIGAAAFTVLTAVSIQFYRQEDIRLALCCWFVVGSVAAVTAGRALWLPPELILTSRYTLLSVFLVTTLTLLLQKKIALVKTSTIYLLVPLAGIYWIWANLHFQKSLDDVLQWRYSQYNNDIYFVLDRPQAESNNIVARAISSGIYKPPCKPFPKCKDKSAPGE